MRSLKAVAPAVSSFPSAHTVLPFDSLGLLREGEVSGRALPLLAACIYFCLALTAPEKATVLSVVLYPDPSGIQAA